MSYAAAPPPPPPASTSYPGKVLGLVGLLVAIFCGGLIGLILSIVAFVQSKNAGVRNNVALAGIIVGAVVLVGAIVSWTTFGAALYHVYQQCQTLGPGEHNVNGVTYTCG